MTFTIGDKVVINPKSEFYGQAHQLPKGVIGKIVAGTGKEGYAVEWNGDHNYYRIKDLLPVYKAGDRVRIKDTERMRSWGGGKAIGKILTIKENEADYMMPHSCDGVFTLDDNKYCINYTLDDIELVTDPIPHTFKVGDRVRSRQMGCEYTGTVTRVEKNCLSVKRDDLDFGFECIITSDGRVATANGMWDEKSYLEKLEEEPGYKTATEVSLCGGAGEAISYSYEPFWGAPVEVKHKKTLKEVTHMLSTLAKKLLDSDVKALVEVGWLDSELEVTESGEQAIDAMIVEEHKVELAKRARAILAEAKKK